MLICACCLKHLGRNEGRIQTNEKTQLIFKSLVILYELESGVLCSKCNCWMLSFDVFQRDLIKKHCALHEKRNKISLMDTGELKEEQIITETLQHITKIKKEPEEPDDLALIEPKISITNKIKTEPEESPVSCKSIQVSGSSDVKLETLTDDKLGIDDVIIKEEYQIVEEIMDSEEEKEDQTKIDSNNDFHFDPTNGLTIRENVKKRLEQKVNKKKQRTKHYKPMGLSSSNGGQKSISFGLLNAMMKAKSCINFKGPVMGPTKRKLIPQRINESLKNQFKCEHCSYTSRYRDFVISHIKRSHAFRCTICSKIFSSLQNLDDHKLNEHKASESRRKQKLQPKIEDKPAFRLRTKKV